jgi:muramoyltetrapeptide carboxypeptidase LdcA involved in peptidoglycan recycling
MVIKQVSFKTFFGYSQIVLNQIQILYFTAFSTFSASNLFKSDMQKHSKINVYNTLGQMVFQSKNANSVDFTEMPTGIYLLEIVSETKKTQVIRVLKH